MKKRLCIYICVAIAASCASGRRSTAPVTSPPVAVVRDEPVTVPVSEPVVVREERITMVETSEPEMKEYNFYIIIGSFRVYNNAQQYKAQLITEGFEPVVLENENGLYRVSVGASNDERTVRDRIALIRKEMPQYSDIWLLVRKR